MIDHAGQRRPIAACRRLPEVHEDPYPLYHRLRAEDPVHRERQAIAAYAATLVKPGSAILLGPGRTTYLLACELTAISSLTVVTNSVLVTQALLRSPHIDVVMVGGALRRIVRKARSMARRLQAP